MAVDANENDFESGSDDELVVKAPSKKLSKKRKRGERSSDEESPDADSSEGSTSSDGTSSSSEEEEADLTNPKLAKLLMQLVKNKRKKKDKKKRKEKDRSRDKLRRKRSKKEKKGKSSPAPVFRSPSDSAVYTPALNKVTKTPENSPIAKRLDMSQDFAKCVTIDKISEFLDNIRLEQANKEKRSKRRESAAGTSKGHNSSMEEEQTNRSRAEDAVIEAEKYKASIEPPHPGKFRHLDDESLEGIEPGIDTGDDDELFDIALHVEENLRIIIRKGGFVEIERLVPKLEARSDTQEHALKIMNKDGFSYLVAGEERETKKINNYKKWLEGFKVYAAIFTEANLARAAEMWQYIHTIGNAAATYQWSNVAYYDFSFRKIMAKRPNRSWAKTHMQLWTTSMKHHVQMSNNQNSSQKKKDWRDNVCWKFNKNRCKDSKCRFEHRCSYCGSYSHVALMCQRKRKSDEADVKKHEGKNKGHTPSASAASSTTTVN